MIVGLITDGYHCAMKLANLRALIAAVEEGSLRAAGRRLRLSQPALTKMIQELERELSSNLLSRSRTGVFPTAQGTVLYERAVAAERELGHAVDQIRQFGGEMAGELTVGAVPLALMLLIPETVRTFGRAFPRIQLRIMEELFIAHLNRLRKGEVDIALGPLPEDLTPGEFEVQSLMPIAMVIVVRKGNPLAKARRLADLAKAPWVYTGATADSGYAKILYERNGMPPPPTGAIVNSTLGLLAIVANGDCVGLLPRQIAVHPFASQSLDLVSVAEGPLNLVLGALARSDVALKPSVRHFLAHLHRAAHQLTEPRRPSSTSRS